MIERGEYFEVTEYRVYFMIWGSSFCYHCENTDYEHSGLGKIYDRHLLMIYYPDEPSLFNNNIDFLLLLSVG
jgi:hypothetical protein